MFCGNQSKISKIYMLHPHFSYKSNQLCAEGVVLKDIAKEVETPFFVYSSTAITEQYKRLVSALDGTDSLVCYAVKANSNQAVLRTVCALGAGADVVSGGELRRALEAGFDPRKIVFAGVGKSESEMRQGLSAKILQFNVESLPELECLNNVAQDMGCIAPVALRINPDVDARTHQKITTGRYENKFGIDLQSAFSIIERLQDFSHLRLEALSVHIGSQLTEVTPYNAAYWRLADFVRRVMAYGIALERLDLGGGLGISYSNDDKPQENMLESYVEIVKQYIVPLGLPMIFEPGRYLVGNAGLLISRLLYVKEGAQGRKFMILDAAMNDLLRPALYDAHHELLPLVESKGVQEYYDIVGPVCESGDTFAKHRLMSPVNVGDFLAFSSVGAYGAVMSSNYNTRPLAAEIMVKDKDWATVRKRQSIEALIAADNLPPWLG